MNSARKTEIKHRAEALADSFRNELHLTSTMPVDVRGVIKEKYIQALLRKMDESASGMAMKVRSDDGEEHRFMMINIDKSLGNQRFTCCHEFYHLLFQNNFNFVNEKTATFDEKNEEEYCADWFASYLILPAIGLKRMIPDRELKLNSITLGTLLKIENNFGCSRKTLLFRLKDCGYINGATFDRFSENIRMSAISYGYTTELYYPTTKEEYIGDYNIKARELFNSGLISQSKYELLLEDIGIYVREHIEDDGEI